MSSNASELYERIQNDQKHTKVLFRQALQDPQGALQAICDLGSSMGLPVTPDEVKAHLASLDDAETKQVEEAEWLEDWHASLAEQESTEGNK